MRRLPPRLLPFVLASATLVPAAIVACNSLPVYPLPDDDDAAVSFDSGSPAPPAVELGRHSVQVIDTRRIVPSAGQAPDATVLNSNNNLDVVRFDGRVWLVWRTAPDHFASDKTIMVIVSSSDEITWRLEKLLSTRTDLREPRFLVVGNALFLYVARLGTDPIKFEPQGVSYSKRAADGSWTDLAPVMRATAAGDGADAGDGGDAGTDASAGDGGSSANSAQPMTGYIAWRTKNERGTPYMTAYLGGEHIYQFDGLPLDVELLTTGDGVTWRGVSPARPVVSRGGGSESDFALGDDGSLFAVIRNEAGDATGFGAKVCRAPASDITSWTCKSDPRKYDSPLMFWHDGEAYLVGRRNVTETGNYDLGTRDPNLQQSAIAFQLDYKVHTKRCALWRYVQGEDRIAYILDLPSRGDTCFAAKIDTSAPGELAIYDYSSDINGDDVSWTQGQGGPTYVYRHVLRFTPR